jgi:hypothetical protein
MFIVTPVPGVPRTTLPAMLAAKLRATLPGRTGIGFVLKMKVIPMFHTVADQQQRLKNMCASMVQ